MPSDTRCLTCGSTDPKVCITGPWTSKDYREPGCPDAFHDTPPADPPRDEVMAALERLTARARANASAQDRKEMHTGVHTHEVDEDSDTLRAFIERSQP